MIYAPVISAGSVAVTRLSKAFCEDTKRALNSHGVYRVEIASVQMWNTIHKGTWRWDSCATNLLPSIFLANVQSLHITISFEYDSRVEFTGVAIGTDRAARVTGILSQLAKSVVNCKHFHVVFKDGPVIFCRKPRISRLRPGDLLVDNMEFLDRLSTVTVEWWADPKNGKIKDKLHSPEDDREAIARIEALLGFKVGCLIGDPRFALIHHTSDGSPSSVW